jgi:glyoxylase-like metal-dependent hydrolase (beta-lactamase superfamily II)
MEVDRIADGLWRWTAFHEEWKHDVGCVYCESGDAVCLVDPLVPPDDRDRFLAALDRDVERLGLPVHVLITVYWHTRSARELTERYGAEVWASSRIRAAVERRAGRVRAFRSGEVLPGGIETIASVKRNDTLFFVRRDEALVAGDVILGAEGRTLRFCPESWLPKGVGHAELRASLQPLLDLPVERVLVSHGAPVLADGAQALHRLLGADS